MDPRPRSYGRGKQRCVRCRSNARQEGLRPASPRTRRPARRCQVTWQQSLLELLERWLHSSEGQDWQRQWEEVLSEALQLSQPRSSLPPYLTTWLLEVTEQLPLESTPLTSLSLTSKRTRWSGQSLAEKSTSFSLRLVADPNQGGPVRESSLPREVAKSST